MMQFGRKKVFFSRKYCRFLITVILYSYFVNKQQKNCVKIDIDGNVLKHCGY